jgi:transposase
MQSDASFSPRDGWVIIMMEAAMPTVCLRFRFEEHPRIRALMEACADIQRQAVDYALENGKTATFTLIKALYPSLRERYPHLHSQLIYGAIRSGARVVHGFRNQQRKGKTQANRPEIRRPSVYLVRQTVKIEWDGEILTVTIPVSPRDPEPIVLTFRPHHKYRRLLDEWKAGRARMGEPTLTAHSLSIPLKFPDPIPYEPEGVIGIDSNEGNLTAFVTSTGEIREIDTRYVGKVNRDHLRREIKGTRGKHNPKAKKKIASKHGRIRREKTENFWHHLALALMAWAIGMKAALVLEDLKGMKERIGEGKSRRMRQRLLNFWSIMTFHAFWFTRRGFMGFP